MNQQIVITSEHLASDNVSQTLNNLQHAKEIPLIRQVGEDKASMDGLFTILILLGAGLISGVLTWLAWNNLPVFKDPNQDSTTANLWASFTITVIIAIVLVAADAGQSRSLPKLGMALAIATPAALLLAWLLGMLANEVYKSMVEQTYNSLTNQGLDPSTQAFWDSFASKNHLNRGLAWSILGLAAGLSVGVSSRSVKRSAITAGGGFAGGFIGGFVFDYFTGSQDLSQVVGLAITGGSVGLAVSLLEQATKSSWIEIVRGGMSGKQFILYQNEVTLGSSPNANITLIKDPAIAPIAAVIRRRGATVLIKAANPAVPVSVNGVASYETQLSEGALITLGSTELRFREKSKKVSNAAIVRNY